MSDNNSIGNRFRDFQPSKGMLGWSFVGGVIVTLVVGFAFFDWKTAGSAQEMAEEASTQARAELAATMCVERFMDGTNVAQRLATLKEESSWARDSVITDGGWTTFAGMEEPVEEAAELCASRLVEMEAPTDPPVVDPTVDSGPDVEDS